MTYNEYWQVIDAGIPADELLVFKYEDEGVATLEDGLTLLPGHGPQTNMGREKPWLQTVAQEQRLPF